MVYYWEEGAAEPRSALRNAHSGLEVSLVSLSAWPTVSSWAQG